MKKKSKTYKIHYYDETGKRRGKTFSAPTLTEAKLKAEEWQNTRLDDKGASVTVLGAVEGYISIKAAVLSPATVRGYESVRDNALGRIRDRAAGELTRADLQAWVSELAQRYSPKTVRNAYGLVSSALAFYGVTVPGGTTLPQMPRKDVYCPGDAEIAALIAEVRHSGDLDLLRAIYLAAFVPARRSEICALTRDDVRGDTVTISKAMVMPPGGGWVVKPPKVKDSHRTVVLPAFVIDELQKAPDRLVNYNPNRLSAAWRRALADMNIKPFRLHDLRSYGASIMMYQGISQKTIEQRGGWAPGSPVLRRIYQNKIEAEQRKENEKINAHFSQLA